MNKARKQSVARSIEKLREISSALSNVKDFVERDNDDEQDYYDNAPENLQNSERYTLSDEALSSFENAMNALDDASSSVEDAIEALEEIIV